MEKDKATQVPDVNLREGFKSVQTFGGSFRIRLKLLERIKVLLGYSVVVSYSHDFSIRTSIVGTRYSVRVKKEKEKDQ